MTDPVVLALAQCGGRATLSELLELITRHQIRSAHTRGTIERLAHGRYALPGLGEARQAAVRLAGTVSHRSAAVAHGWSVRSAPKHPDITVPRSRDIPAHRRRSCQVWWRDLAPDEVEDSVTLPLRTVIDCARDLPLEESLAVADSALRSGAVSDAELLAAGTTLPRSRRARATVVLESASGDAANPFESALRALSIAAAGPIFTPQVTLAVAGARITPDLVCDQLRIVIEADSHEFHTSRDQIVKDCWRYDELVLAGWLVLRFSWVHVMFHQAWAKDVIQRAVRQQS